MNVHDSYDQLIDSWFAEGPNRIPEAALNRILAEVERTNERQPSWLPRREMMNRIVLAAGSVAAVVLIAAIGIGLVSGGAFGPGGATQTPSPTPEQTVAPSPTASPQPAPEAGNLRPGTYISHPLQAADSPLSVTYTVADGWSTMGENLMLLSDGVGLQLFDISNLNGDPCDWSGAADDLSVGATVDELVEALGAQSAYEASEPIDVAIGGYSGKRVDIIYPADWFTGPDADGHYASPGCDEGQRYIWNSNVFGAIYGQGPDNRWQTNILDVDGTRLLVVAMDFPHTSDKLRAEIDAVIDSFVIEP